MRERILVLLLVVCSLQIADSYEWTALRAKWGTFSTRDSNFKNLIRRGTVDVEDWKLSEDLGYDFEKEFNVTIYCLSDDASLCTMYDVENHIIGMQIGFPVSAVDAFGSPLNYRNKPYVKRLKRFGKDVYVMTLFFFDPVPELFLNGKKDWDGKIGDGLWLLNWSGDKYFFTQIPTDLTEMRAEGFSKHRCVNGMGTHYFKDLNSKTSCSDIFPLFITYDDEKPIGFGIYTLGLNLFSEFGKWNEATLGYPSITKDVPVCLLLSSVYPGLFVTHFYFTPQPAALRCLD